MFRPITGQQPGEKPTIDIDSEEQRDRCQTKKPVDTPTPRGLSWRHHHTMQPPTTYAEITAPDNIKTSRTVE